MKIVAGASRGAVCTLLLLTAGCTSSADDNSPRAEVEPEESQAAGHATSFDFSDRAFNQPLRDLSGEQRTRYLTGQALFEVDWAVARGSLDDRDGLGPTYNATSCQACHKGNGRGAPPLTTGGTLTTALLRVSIPGGTPSSGPTPHPIYGDQIQPHAISGVPREGEVRIFYEETNGTYSDGSTYSLLKPQLRFTPALGDPGPDLETSVRVAAATLGLGFLAAIPDADLLAQADPTDADGNGISGRPNWVPDPHSGTRTMGRFGWKATQPNLMQQNAAAFLGDLGLTSPFRPVANCPAAQTACALAPSGGAPEVDGDRMAALLSFVRGTSVPARRDVGDAVVLRGKKLFHTLGCAACHVPRWLTAEVPDFPALSAQHIWPYTDLLLHDLGTELADGRADFEASGQEWRTPPLWGLGLQERVSGHLRLLHDGRARGFAEAILWHGGEALSAMHSFRELSQADRNALVTFLGSL